MLFWKAHNCRTVPGGKGGAATRRDEEEAARKKNAAEDDANIVRHGRNLVEERDRLYEQQQARLKTEAAKERVLLAKMLQDRAKGSTVTGNSAGVRQARPPTEDSPAGARSSTATAGISASAVSSSILPPCI